MCLFQQRPELSECMPDNWLSSKVAGSSEAPDLMRRYVIQTMKVYGKCNIFLVN
jgi:hypothetical protein